MTLIYCRVSSARQEEEGSGLQSQEHRCREKARQLGCEVEKIFPDVMTGGGDFMKRRGMVDLLAHLDANPHKRYLVIFDDLKRYSRDTEFHLALRREMQARNAIRLCLNFNFEDTPEGKFYETVMAATGTLEREQNARQTRQKTRARMEQGYWALAAPKGYTYVKAKAGGHVLVPDEPIASVVREAYESYACGRLETLAEVRRFLESHPDYPKDKKGRVPQQRVTELLTRPLYAGYICNEGYGIQWLKAKHEPLISLETYEKVQERRVGKVKAPLRKNLNESFPLRGFVLCGDCGNPFTACFSKGRSNTYPYYLCDTKGCDSYRKSIPRAQIEGEFADIVQSLQPTATP
ncbi:MAG: recombinase family protein [Nitratireductor sp.]|nr:recombinase family protein [Nitratireductor sp.]